MKYITIAQQLDFGNDCGIHCCLVARCLSAGVAPEGIEGRFNAKDVEHWVRAGVCLECHDGELFEVNRW